MDNRSDENKNFMNKKSANIVVGVYVIWIPDTQIEWNKKYFSSSLINQDTSKKQWVASEYNKI